MPSSHDGHKRSYGEPLPEDQAWKVISLFSGCGGMDLGFLGGFHVFGHEHERLPFNVTWANDLNEAACRTYERNIGPHIVPGSIWDHLDEMPNKADVIIGGFPCQDLSVNGKRAGVAGARSGLYRAMVEAIDQVRPRIFVAENVKGLLLKYNRDSLNQVIDDFTSLGYRVTYDLYRAADYGVPQNRERVFIVGLSDHNDAFSPPAPVRSSSTWMTALEAIDDLAQVEERQDINHIWSRANRSPEQGNRRLEPNRPAHTIRAECHGNIQYHYRLPRRLSMREAARIQSFPDDFIFAARLRETERQVGNAVPPVLAWHVAKSVAATLAGNDARSEGLKSELALAVDS